MPSSEIDVDPCDHITSDASLTEETDPARLTPKQWDPWMNHVFLPATASKYGACRADIHERWKEYLKANHMKAADLLRDGFHLNAHGEWLMAELLKADSSASRAQDESLFGSFARQKAVRLLAGIEFNPADPKLEEAVAELMAEQKDGEWLTTQGNAWGVLALAEYSRRVEGVPGPCEGRLLCGTESFPFHFEGSNNVVMRTFPMRGGLPAGGIRLVDVKGTVFSTVTLSARPKNIGQTRRSQGLGGRQDGEVERHRG